VNIQDQVVPAIPACWETVLDRYVLLVGGPMSEGVSTWPHGLERLVMSNDGTGYYRLSDGGHFGQWEKNDAKND
jgi:hypothetical protein